MFIEWNMIKKVYDLSYIPLFTFVFVDVYYNS